MISFKSKEPFLLYATKKLLYNKWITFCAAAICILGSGTLFTFVSYVDNIKEMLDYSQDDINFVSNVGSIGIYCSTIVLFFVPLIGPTIAIVTSGCTCALGYTLIYCLIHNWFHTTNVYLFAVIFFLTNFSSVCLYGISMNITVANFGTKNRGIIVGILIGCFGLSSFLFSLIFSIFIPPEEFTKKIVLLAISIIVISLTTAPFLRYTNQTNLGIIGLFFSKCMWRLSDYFKSHSIGTIQDTLSLASENFTVNNNATPIDSPAPVMFINEEGDKTPLRSDTIDTYSSETPNVTVDRQSKASSQRIKIKTYMIDEEVEEEITQIEEKIVLNYEKMNVHPLLMPFYLETWLIFTILATIGGSVYTMYVNFGSWNRSLYGDPSNMNYYVMLFSLTNFIGRVGTGIISDILKKHVPLQVIILIISILSCIFMLFCSFVQYSSILWLYSICLGLLLGAIVTAVPNFLVDRFGKNHAGVKVMFSPFSISTGNYFLGVQLVSRFYHHYGVGNTCKGPKCFSYSWLATSALSFLGCICSYLLLLLTRDLYLPVKKHKEQGFSKRILSWFSKFQSKYKNYKNLETIQ